MLPATVVTAHVTCYWPGTLTGHSVPRVSVGRVVMLTSSPYHVLDSSVKHIFCCSSLGLHTEPLLPLLGIGNAPQAPSILVLAESCPL